MNKTGLKWLVLAVFIAATVLLFLLFGGIRSKPESPLTFETPGFEPGKGSITTLPTELSPIDDAPKPQPENPDGPQTPSATPVPTLQALSENRPGPLFVNPGNPRYFTDGTLVNGHYKVIYLTGSHTWCNFTDCGNTDPPPVFDYTEFLNFLEAHNHNFFRLWRAENVRGGEGGDDFWFDPIPYQRSATECCAFDGGNKFDLDRFDQAYFDRLHQRVLQAQERGIYVAVMLFDGWSVENKSPAVSSLHQPWKGHPYHIDNNINNVDGDVNRDQQGGETHTLVNAQITILQEAFARKVIDTLNDLDNVLYEISNESTGGDENRAWQYHMIQTIKAYEAGLPKQHPVGMTVAWPNGSNQDVYQSPADWVSLNGDLNNPPVADGTKVILADTDHLCGICGDRQWVWKSFTRGENPIFMDFYDNAVSGRGIPFENPYQEEIRLNLGYTRAFAARLNLAAMLPSPDLCSTGYCLANPTKDQGDYLVYAPHGGTITLNLWATPGELRVEWLNPANGEVYEDGTIMGGKYVSFNSPFEGDSVLHVFR